MTNNINDGPVSLFVGNHRASSITDFIDLILYDLREIGKAPILSNELLNNNTNVIIENFDRDIVSKIKSSFSKNDRRLIMIATEVVKDGLLDSASPAPDEVVAGWYDAKSKVWLERTNNFFEIVDYFGHIICVSEEIYQSLVRLNLNAKILYWKPRFTGQKQMLSGGEESFKSFWINQNVKTTKIHQLMFSGSLTPYRDKQINELVGSGRTVLQCPQDTPQNVRYQFSLQSGLSFGPKHYRSTIQMSKMRLLWCLNNFFPVVMQKCSGVSDLDNYCVFYTDVEDLLERCTDMSSTYLECLKKNLQFCLDTELTSSPFKEIFS